MDLFHQIEERENLPDSIGCREVEKSKGNPKTKTGYIPKFSKSFCNGQSLDPAFANSNAISSELC